MSVVLMYHRVANPTIDPHKICVSPKHFREQLSVIQETAEPKCLDDVYANWSKQNKDVAVTFDDGYADNLNEALPLLEREHIPATIFVSTGYLDREGFWIDRLAKCLFTGQDDTKEATFEYQGRRFVLKLGTPEERESTHDSLHVFLRKCPPRMIQLFIDKLAATLKVNPIPSAENRPLTTREAAHLVRHPLIDLGGHTVNHPYLSSLKPSEQKREIESCKASLVSIGVMKPLPFAYPFGDPESYSLVTQLFLRKSRWRFAVIANHPKQRFWLKRYAVPRRFVGDWSGEEFRRRLLKWLKGG